jgi:tetratricopeptide (TPR) repeat protein
VWQPPDARDPSALAAVYPRAEALYRAGQMEDALALLPAGQLTQPTPESLRVLLLRGRMLTDQVFHANRGYGEAQASLRAARTLAQQLGDEAAAINALELLALADYYRMLQTGAGDYRPLLARFEETLARREALGDTRGIAESVFHVGLIHERLSEREQAWEAYERAYQLAKQHGHKTELSYAARHLGSASFESGDLDAALSYFEESLALRQEAGLTLNVPLAHLAVGDVLLARQDRDGAARHYEQAYALAQGMQSPLAVVLSELALSELAQARGDTDARRDYAEQALSRAQVAELPLGIRAATAALDALRHDRT